ncbi:putative XRE-type DNA-binding protein [Bradyrhizobium elkanii]|uniref:helix-turn-helix domain-containing protein n=1 Tax=Bradyrhizobium TaxID=374 RepID=UPI002169C910|nr:MULTISPECIES: helix-turn-helix domain-containing protein [Bradyrhizobium]MCS3928997.1 putative XRE-type DNA-binding protein [Bradyrhizobium elkanii]MCS3969553.1 putative XRE-type DNA-binding protein [Bradyrhizobium japonicum]
MTARRDGLRNAALGVIGSGNVFADLGFEDPVTELTKAKVVIEVDEVIKKRGLTHAGAARIMRIPLQALTKLLHGHTGPYTVERLRELLGRLAR